jgi:hypothetical protein
MRHIAPEALACLTPTAQTRGSRRRSGQIRLPLQTCVDRVSRESAIVITTALVAHQALAA